MECDFANDADYYCEMWLPRCITIEYSDGGEEQTDEENEEETDATKKRATLKQSLSAAKFMHRVPIIIINI